MSTGCQRAVIYVLNDIGESSEQLRVSLAIAMAANPKLRVIRNIIREMAAERDYQVWCDGSVSLNGE